MMYCKRKFFIAVSLLLTTAFYNLAGAQEIDTDTIPLGGNAWVKMPAEITDSGLIRWSDAKNITSIYFRTDEPQTFNLLLRLQVPEGKTKISIASGNTHYNKEFDNRQFAIVNIGKLVVVKPGYVKVDLQGISKTGAVFANISDLIVQHDKPHTNLIYVKNGSSFHFGRRGPSVHLRYPIPGELSNDVHWFYNEITIPAGDDKIGSYFMADGFGEGYFGMQVNSSTERRVLFSVWSPFETENPADIPDSMRIVLLKKGVAVHTQDFGNEGSGGQSYMPFMWQAGKTYAFLLGAQPDTLTHSTTYTAYFKDISADKWYLIASFKRPQTLTYLTHLYSFLENFIPETGNETRMGLYKNQWIMDGRGAWHELTNAIYTADATARGGYRKDYAGGTNSNYFFLRNDGFFDDFIQPDQPFTREASGRKPVIDFLHLPQQ